MAQRSRKRGRHGPPPAVTNPTGPPAAAPPQRASVRATQSPPPHLPRESRSEARNAEVRAALKPLEPGERPRAIVASSLLAAALAFGNLIAWLLGATVAGRHPAASEIIVFTLVFAAAAIGLWRLSYGAVLGFMALLAIVAVLCTLLLVEASSILGAVVALAVIVICGYLFFKLVRVLSRIQIPRSPQQRS